MLDAARGATGLPRLRRALNTAAETVCGAAARTAWYTLGWRWLALLGGLFVVDLLFGLDVWLRWLALLGQVGFVVAGVRRAATCRRLAGRGDEWAARLVEQRHPEADSALINAVQFERALPEAQPHQAGLMAQEIARGEGLAGDVELAGVADRMAERRELKRLGGAALAWVVVAVLFPAGFLAVIPRLFAPWMDDVTPPFSLTRYDVRPPGASVRYGDSLNIAVAITGPIPDRVSLMTRTAGGPWRRMDMEASEQGRYTASLADLREDTWFFAQGQGSRSARYRIVVVRPPNAKALRVTYTYPRYTGRQPYTETVGGSGLHGLIHTVARLEIASDRKLERGEVVLESMGAEPERVPVVPDAKDPSKGIAQFTLTRPGTFRVSLTADDGQTNQDAARGKVAIDKDERPSVWIEQPGQDLLVTPAMRVAIVAQAEDDTAVAGMETHRLINDLGDSPLPAGVPQPVPAVRQAFTMDLPDLGVRPGDKITYYATAFDNQPGRPNIGESEPLTLKVVTQQEYEEALRQQRQAEDLEREAKDIASAVQDLAERQDELARRMAELERALARKPGDQALQRKLADARAEQRKLQEDARQAAGALCQYAQSPSATAFERAVKAKLAQIAQALANAASGPMQAAQAGGPQAAANAREAAKRLGQANAQMQRQVMQALEQIMKVLPLYMDVERFKELLSRQGQLVLKARQYERTASSNPADRARLEQLASEQNRIQQELRRLQDDFRQHAADCQADFPRAAASARRIADEIGRRQIPDTMQEGQDRFRQWDGPRGFQSAQAALRQMQAMAPECQSCQGNACQGELDISLARIMGQNGLGNCLAQMAQALSMGQGSGGAGSGTAGFGGIGGFASPGPRAYTPSLYALRGSRGTRREQHQNRVAGTPAGLAPQDVEVVGGDATKPPRAADADSGRYPAEYRKLVGEYFKSVAEGK